MNFLTIWFKIKLKFGFIFREGVKSIILEIFAGPADRGEYSPSVQNTLYLTAQKVLEKMPEVSRHPINQIYLLNLHKICCGLCLISYCKVFYLFQVEKVYINLPNVHYFGVDYSRFPKIDFVRNDDNVSFIRNAFMIFKFSCTWVVLDRCHCSWIL